MDLFDIWVLILLILTAPAVVAYPLDSSSQNLALTSPRVISQLNLTHLVQGYPAYPTACFPRSRGPIIKPSELPSILSDCSWIINEDLLQQRSLLSQDLVFGYTHFRDQDGNRYPSRWHHGRCVIDVASMWKDRQQTLQLFNIVLSANKILKECMVDKQVPQGGTTPIGFLANSFYVGVLGLQATPTDESDRSSSSNFSIVERDMERSHLHTTPTSEPPLEDYDTAKSTMSLPRNVAIEKRASDPQHRSSPLAGTQELDSGGALSTTNLMVPSNDLSGSVEAPPIYAVQCFNPFSQRLRHVAADDCQVVIDHIILRLPNLMSPQTFGYTSSADIDLSLPENEKWVYGCCVIFVRNRDKTRVDTFRLVDVATTAQRIVTECVSGAKYPKGGAANIGTVGIHFHVGVAGVIEAEATNSSTLHYPYSVESLR